jgi:glyoxylase-like metal-dependent hydrolase (beta-lactamase superfamily II)
MKLQSFVAPVMGHGAQRQANAYRIDGVTVEPNALSGRVGPAVRTHDHYDHSSFAGPWSDPEWALDGWEVIPTPGHAPEHVCFMRDDILIAGDVVEGPGGTWPLVFDVWAMILTLEHLSELPIRLVLPGHGHVCGPEAFVAHRDHLLRSQDRIVAAVRNSRFGEIEDIVANVRTIEPELLTVRAHLDALVAAGRLRRDPEMARWHA